MSKQKVLELFPNLQCLQDKECTEHSVYFIVTESGLCTYEGSYTAASTWKGLYKAILERDFDPYWRDKMYAYELAEKAFEHTDEFKKYGKLYFIEYVLKKHDYNIDDFTDSKSIIKLVNELCLKDFPIKV